MRRFDLGRFARLAGVDGELKHPVENVQDLTREQLRVTKNVQRRQFLHAGTVDDGRRQEAHQHLGVGEETFCEPALVVLAKKSREPRRAQMYQVARAPLQDQPGVEVLVRVRRDLRDLAPHLARETALDLKLTRSVIMTSDEMEEALKRCLDLIDQLAEVLKAVYQHEDRKPSRLRDLSRQRLRSRPRCLADDELGGELI